MKCRMTRGLYCTLKRILTCILVAALIISYVLPVTTSKAYADETPLTRKEFAAIIVDLLNLEFDAHMAEDVSFSDVNPGLEEYEAIITSCYYQYFGGFEDGTFKPDQIMVRSQIATLLCRVTGIDVNNVVYEPNPIDVPSDKEWPGPYVRGALQNNLMSVDSNNCFNPNMDAYLSDINMPAVQGLISAAAVEGFSFDASTGTITGYNGNRSIVSIPSEIDGVPITRIAHLGMQNAIEKIVIPSSVTEIETNAFGLCWNLKSFQVDSQNPVFSTNDGVLFSKDGKTLIRFPRGKSGVYTVPDGVERIESLAFCDVFGVPSVILSSGVTEISSDAFNNCSLSSITLPDSLQVIKESAFSYCDDLHDVYYMGNESAWNNITIEDGNDYLLNATRHFIVASGSCGENATWTLDSNGILMISGSGDMYNYTWPDPADDHLVNTPWFSYRTDITSVAIGDGISRIGNLAFYELPNITAVTLPNSLISIGYYAFENCEKLESINLPDSVTTIGESAFGDCTSLSQLHISSNLTEIPIYAFQCANLNEITIPGSVIQIGIEAFRDCKNATIVSIEEGVQRIAETAFGACTNLRTVFIPSSVTTIERNAFQYCNNLSDVYYDGTEGDWNNLTIDSSAFPASAQVTFHYKTVLHSGTCGTNAFWTLYDDGTLVVSGSGDMYDYRYDSTSAYKAYNDQITSIIVESDITRIGDYAFYNTSATSFTIHNASLSMGTWAVGNNLNLTDIDFGSGVISPANSVFEDCEALKTIHIPSNVIMNGNSSGEGSGYDMFHSCGSLETAIVDCAYVGRYMFETDHKLKTVTFTNPDVKIYYVQDDFNTGNPFNSIHGDSGSPVLIDVIGYTCSDVSAMVKVLNQRYNPSSYPYSSYTFVPITNDPGHRNIVEDAAVAATCEETGLTAGSHCAACGQVIVAQEKTAALGHDYSEPTYSWSEDNASVTATTVCTHDEAHVLTETVSTTSEVTKEATASEWGETTYTAIFENGLFATQTKTVADIEPTGEPAEAQYVVVYEDGEMVFQATDEAMEGKTIKIIYEIDNLGTHPWGAESANVTKVVFMTAVSPRSTADWFNGFRRLQSIEGLNKVNTTNVTSMEGMFQGCEKLVSLDLTGFDTSNVTNMRAMFDGCSALETLNVNSFNTSNVTNMGRMFGGLNLKSLDLSNFNTTNVTNIEEMFQGCLKLTALDLTSFNTANVTNMKAVFRDCFALTTLNLSSFDTCSTVDMSYMFSGCCSLSALDLTGFNTSKVLNMNNMFNGCSALALLDLSSFNTNMVKDMNSMFSGCRAVSTLDLTHFDTSNVTNMNNMFGDCQSLTTLDLTHFNTSNVTKMDDMFYSCSGLKTLCLSNFNTANVRSMYRMFYYCSSLTTLDISAFNTVNLTNMDYMFCGCNALKTIYAKDVFIAPQNSKKVFNQCASLVGGNGTVFNPNYADGNYARIDTFESPGYFTYVVHDHVFSFVNGFAATCEMSGRRDYWVCSICGAAYADETGENLVLSPVIPPQGHDWSVASFTWSEDNSSVTAIATCKRDSSHIVTETVDTISVITKEPTENEYGETMYTASFTNELFEQQIKVIANIEPTGPIYAQYAVVYDNSEMVFQASNESINGRSIQSVFEIPTGDYSNPPWNGCSGITTVTFADKTCPTTTKNWFSAFSSLTTINNISMLDTSNVTDMSGMFDNCTALKELDVSNFNTSNVTDMSYMFYFCPIQTIDVSHFNTSKVTNMSGMFGYCYALEDLDVRNFDTSNVTNMGEMFAGLTLMELDLSTFDTHNVTSMRHMFDGCIELKTIYTEKEFVVSNNSAYMFSGCKKLVGGNGTVYSNGHDDGTYAFIDKTGRPGYFTHKMHINDLVLIDATAATCESSGNSIYYVCSVCDKCFDDAEGKNEIGENSWVIPAIGHLYGSPEWAWSNDYSTVTATFTCEHDETHIVEVTASLMNGTIITDDSVVAQKYEDVRKEYAAQVTGPDGEIYENTATEVLKATHRVRKHKTADNGSSIDIDVKTDTLDATVSGETISSETPVLVASYDENGRFMGLVYVKRENDAAVEVSDEANSIKIFWVNMEDASPKTDAEEIVREE